MKYLPSIAAMVARFHDAFGEPFGCSGGRGNELRAKLHVEENRELIEALFANDRVGIAHELADVVYVAYGTAHSLGIPLDAVIAEVHAANMRKFGPDGKPVLRDDGKVLKPPGWQPADVERVLKRCATPRSDPRAPWEPAPAKPAAPEHVTETDDGGNA